MLVAGLGGASDYWLPQADEFAKRYRVILHDHRGTGRSSRDLIDYTVSLLTDDMVRLMDHLSVERAHVVGHSTGAAMTEDMALRYPERLASAVLYAGWARTDAYFRRIFDIRKELLSKSGAAAYVKTTSALLYSRDWFNSNVSAIEAGELAAMDLLPPAEIMLRRIDAICSFNPGEALRGIRCRSLIVCAEDDILTPAEYSREMAELIPEAQTWFFEQGGHAVSQTAPLAFNRVVMSYLDAAIEDKPWQAHGDA
ncbi:MAG: alpha/beta fold hydrolase [Bradyrhizobium sp.]